MKSQAYICLWVLLGCLWSAAQAQEHHDEHLHQPLAVALAVDEMGRILMAQVKQGHVVVSVSEDAGQHFGQGVSVNPEPTSDEAARPQIALGPNAHVYVTWTQSAPHAKTEQVWFARSVDGGKKFETPYVVHQPQDEVTHHFERLQVTHNGNIAIVWLDDRDVRAAIAAGISYEGEAIYYAFSSDYGKSFQPEQKLADHSCACCQIAMTNLEDDTVALLWRHVFDRGESDYAMAEINPSGQSSLVRVSYGHWREDGCSQHGSALAVGEGFGYHLVYFEGGGDRPGLRVARMDNHAWVTSPPRRIGDTKKHAGQPALFSLDQKVWLAWQEHDSTGVQVLVMSSLDGGRTWGPVTKLLNSSGKLDAPQWLNVQGQIILAVNTSDSGLQLIPFNQ